MTKDVKAYLFQSQLKAGSDVAFPVGQRRTGRSRRPKRACKFFGKDPADNRRALVPGHVNAFGMMAEVVQVKAKLAARLSPDDVAKLFDVTRLAIRRESHHLSFVAVMRKPEELRGGGVDDPR